MWYPSDIIKPTQRLIAFLIIAAIVAVVNVACYKLGVHNGKRTMAKKFYQMRMEGKIKYVEPK